MNESEKFCQVNFYFSFLDCIYLREYIAATIITWLCSVKCVGLHCVHVHL